MDSDKLFDCINDLQDRMLSEFGEVKSKLAWIESTVNNHDKEIHTLKGFVYLDLDNPSLQTKVRMLDGEVKAIHIQLQEERLQKVKTNDYYRDAVIVVISGLFATLLTVLGTAYFAGQINFNAQSVQALPKSQKPTQN